jgi:hypothetical protein
MTGEGVFGGDPSPWRFEPPARLQVPRRIILLAD